MTLNSDVKVSILMPVFNAQATLNECLDIDPNEIGNVYQQAKTCAPDWLRQHDEKPFVLNYVRNHGAGEHGRAYLDAAGYVMGEDYLDVA